ncbi:MAG TPA: hypothetical protein DGB32_04605 [Dehalococcoidia bacterium]|jgi:hypothetical protein|nr:hypothetical protein [Dehalococcoidia bacterium]|tara:strand:+ start:554 stop:841 length:288 start_codon:yes stop_codon:yes gene_type:complete
MGGNLGRRAKKSAQQRKLEVLQDLLSQTVKVAQEQAAANTKALATLTEHVINTEKEYDEMFEGIRTDMDSIIEAQKDVAARVDQINVDLGKVRVH